MSKICFVMPESSHIDHNGIPSLLYRFAKLTAESDHDVTVLFTSLSDSLLEHWKAKYEEIGIRFEFLQPSDINTSLSAADLFFRHSYAAYGKLRTRNFDHIYFVDYYALGFHTIQAKKTTAFFSDTVISVLMLGASEYILDRRRAHYGEGMPVFEIRLQYAERYCCQNADRLIGTADIFAWANGQRWALAISQNALEDWSAEKEAVKANWLDLCSTSPEPRWETQDKPRAPKVSVCIAYYNHGKYLPMLLESLEKNSYPNFEVIVVNDGSTDAYSVSVFEEMSIKYITKPYLFYSKENEFTGRTRNFAVSKSSGEYIIFADSDDIVAPDMIEKFVIGILRSGCDCLSAYMCYFDGELPLEQSVVSQGIYTPTGPALELTMFENCIGGINIIIKRDVFLAAGGFGDERYGYEDWRFLIGLSLRGYRLDVVPLCLYYYRILPDSVNRSKDDYESKRWLLSIYYNDTPHYVKYLIRAFCLPSWDMWLERGMVLAKDLERKVAGLEDEIARFQKQLLNLKDQNEVIQVQNMIIQGQVVNLKDENKVLQDNNMALQSKIADIQEQNRTLRNYTSLELLKRVAGRVYKRIFRKSK